MTADHFHITLALFDGIAGLVLAFALMTGTLLKFPKWHRFFVSLGAAGLLSQSVMLIARLNGHSVSEFWWTWAAKDICIGGITLTYAVVALRNSRLLRSTKA